MEGHKHKKQIYDDLSISQWASNFKGFLILILDEVRHHEKTKDEGAKQIIELVFNACDLVQEEQQKRIAENVNLHWPYDGKTEWIDKETIINPENLIK